VSNQVEIVRLGYGDTHGESDRALNFTVEIDSREDAFKALEAIGPYNGFEPSNVIDAIEAIDAQGHVPAIPGAKVSLSVGREGSPCVYVSQIGTKPGAVDTVIRFLLGAGADECDEIPFGAGASFGKTVRAWWD
jgi:hypothetical protein